MLFTVHHELLTSMISGRKKDEKNLTYLYVYYILQNFQPSRLKTLFKNDRIC